MYLTSDSVVSRLWNMGLDEEGMFIDVSSGATLKNMPGWQSYMLRRLEGMKVEIGSAVLDLNSDRFGIGSAIHFTAEAAGFRRYAVQIPKLWSFGPAKCPQCDGSGRRYFCEEDMGDCPHCKGNGGEFHNDHAQLRSVCISLNLLFHLLGSCEYQAVDEALVEVTRPHDLQWLSLTTGVAPKNDGGHSVGGSVSKVFRDAIKHLLTAPDRNDVGETIRTAMKLIDERVIYRKPRNPNSYIRVGYGERGVSLYVADNDRYVSLNAGGTSTIGDHNMDYAEHQITALHGVAALLTHCQTSVA